MNILSPELLRVVVSRARATLRELDPPDVPGTLRKVAVHTDRGLPPPMARRLLEEIDANEWLRRKVADEVADLQDSQDTYEVAAWQFLVRPDGWESKLDDIAKIISESAGDHERDQLRLRVQALESELDKARHRAKRAQRETEMAGIEADKQVTAARTSARIGRESDRQAREEAHGANSRLATKLASVKSERDQARAQLKQSRQEVLRQRRTDRPTDGPPPVNVWGELDELGAARLLDQMSTALRPASEFVEATEPTLPFEHDPMALPHGVAPDDASAIAWLMERTQSYVLIVDGYNVTYLMYSDGFNTSQSRHRLNGDLARYRRLASALPRVIVVYDSDQSGEVSSDPGPGGVEVRFTTADQSADDEVLRLAAELADTAVVVSDDRQVREGAERVGALGLWSKALVGWMAGQ